MEKSNYINMRTNEIGSIEKIFFTLSGEKFTKAEWIALIQFEYFKESNVFHSKTNVGKNKKEFKFLQNEMLLGWSDKKIFISVKKGFDGHYVFSQERIDSKDPVFADMLQFISEARPIYTPKSELNVIEEMLIQDDSTKNYNSFDLYANKLATKIEDFPRKKIEEAVESLANKGLAKKVDSDLTDFDIYEINGDESNFISISKN